MLVLRYGMTAARMPRAFGAGARAISSSSFLRSQARSAAKGKVAAPSIFSTSFLPTSMQQTGARFIHFQRQTVGTVSQKFATVSRQAERVTAQLRRFSQSASDKTGGIAAWYNGLLEKSPLLTKAVTSALIVLGGDLGCQLFIEGGSIDFARLARMFFLGGVLVAPVLHVWYGALFRYVPRTMAPSHAPPLHHVLNPRCCFCLLCAKGGFLPRASEVC